MKFEIRGIWILVLAALFGGALVFFFSKGCGKPAPVIQVPNTDSARIAETIRQSVVDSTRKAIGQQLQAKQIKIDSAARKIALLESERKQLFALNKVYRQQLDKYATVSDGDSLIPVHPSYVLYCDSLADNSVRVEDNYTMYREEARTTQENLEAKISLKDLEITVLSKAKKETDIQNAWLSKGIDEIAKKTKPRNKMFFGVAVAGTQVNPLFGFGLGVGVMNKREQLVNADALMVRGGELMFQVSGKFKISFR